MRVADKYLQTRPEARALAARLGPHPHIVVVPAYGEGALNALTTSLSRSGEPATEKPAGGLLLLVVNEPPDAPEEKRALNLETLRWAESLGEVERLDASTFVVRSSEMDVCVAHRVVPAKHGVGGARAFGGDVALALHASGKLAVPVIFMTDADAIVPRDYVERVDPDAAASVYPFVHEPLHPAITEYEIGLRYYVAGLRWAGSPYAFHTIGSCMAVHADAYASVRGVPLRNAAEDFYLLNKVRKVGRITSLGGDPIRLSGRGSDRVPFGTGRAVLDHEGDTRLYHPRCFEVVRRARGALLADDVEAFDRWGRDELGASFSEATSPLDLRAASSRASAETRSHEARTKHVDGWFDAFVQRKLVHRIRAACLPSPPIRDALRAAPFVSAAGALPHVLVAMRRAELAL